MKQLDLGTFGNSPACHKLIDLLNKEDHKTQHSVLKHINKFFSAIKHLEDVRDVRFKTYFARLLRDEYSHLDHLSDKIISKKLGSYIVNVISTRCKTFIRHSQPIEL